MFDFDPKKNYYDVLWISEDSSEEDIKKAYKKLAMKYHPDRNKGDKWAEEKFKEINEANQVLSDKKKKQQYDAYRKWGYAWFDQMWGGFGGFSWWGFNVEDIFDVFGDFFGWAGGRGAWRSSRPQKGQDLVINLQISFEESFKGTKKTVSYKRNILCDDCKWSWVAKDSQRTTCSVCKWSGAVVSQQRTAFGMMQVQTVCSHCNGQWYTDSKPCPTCQGNGLQQKTEEISVNVPAGVESEQYIHFPWMGHYGQKGAPAGDLYVKFIIQQSSLYKRSGNNIVSAIEISIFDAVLWSEKEIDHPDGKIKIKIPKWLQVGEDIRIPWKGFWSAGFLSNKWDLIIKTKIHVPKKLSKKEEELWKELASI